MDRRLFYWPAYLPPILTVFFLWYILDKRIVSDNSYYFIWIWSAIGVGYAYYFSKKMTLKSVRTGRAWHELSISASLYGSLKPSEFVSDHIIFSILTPVSTASFITFLVILSSFGWPVSTEKPEHSLLTFLEAALIVSGIIAYTSSLRFFVTKSKNYPYYLAMAYFALVEVETIMVIRMQRFIAGLEAYNAFLQRNLKIKIKDPQSFYSLLSSDTVEAQQVIMGKVCQSFHQDLRDIDALRPFRDIKYVMETLYRRDLVTGPGTEKKIEWLSLIGLVTSTLIAIVQLAMPR